MRPPTDTLSRVFRGGSWSRTTATLVRAAYCILITPSIHYCNFGFRCVLRGRAPVEVKP